MSKYQGDELTNPILAYIRKQQFYNGHSVISLELPHLLNVYKIWNAAKGGAVSLLPTAQEQEWFGHSLFTTNVRMYMAYTVLQGMSYLFAPDPHYPITHVAQSASYQPTSYSIPDEDLQLRRYSVLFSIFGHLLGALDVMITGLNFLYKFEKLRSDYSLNNIKKIEWEKVDFHNIVSLFTILDPALLISTSPKPTLLRVFRNEGLLLDATTSPKRTTCSWYEDLNGQRNYQVHIGFPMLYIVNGKWHVPVDARGISPASNLTPDDIPTFCNNIFEEVHRFIGEVYESIWNEFSPRL